MHSESEIPKFKQIQYEFAAHIRNPSDNPRPSEIETRRMKIYNDLFYNNIVSKQSFYISSSGAKKMVKIVIESKNKNVIYSSAEITFNKKKDDIIRQKSLSKNEKYYIVDLGGITHIFHQPQDRDI